MVDYPAIGFEIKNLRYFALSLRSNDKPQQQATNPNDLSAFISHEIVMKKSTSRVQARNPASQGINLCVNRQTAESICT
jgi:hypothetical protein